MFFEDVLMALVFYGMPILAENNKPRLLYYLKRRGYRSYSMNRPDKLWNKLSTAEKELVVYLTLVKILNKHMLLQ